MTHAQAKSRHAQLAVEIRRHDHAYYVEARPAVSDREYDLLYAELLALEKEFPDLVTQNSPSQRVGGGLTESFKRITHEQPMLSLEKIQASDSPTKDEEPDRERRNRLQDERTIEEFRAFDATIRKQLGNVSAFVLEAELVGILTLATLGPIRLHSSGNGTFDGFKIEAVRTSVPICAISRW